MHTDTNIQALNIFQSNEQLHNKFENQERLTYYLDKEIRRLGFLMNSWNI